ncbi:MAG: hypothetical protein MAGBODY4_01118 [Candidatus Marinimicrobia bacterium]|nr:hypothetical protein [Candidatus Neomarinimicrobiota bacterium]
MNSGKFFTSIAMGAILLFAGMLMPLTANAHCARVNGPVATDALQALETGDISPALIWVSEDQEAELKSVFEQSKNVYKQGGESRELAEQYFMSTTVRLHRQAEGQSFTGLKPAQPAAADIQTAEKALVTGDLKPVTNMLAREIEKKATALHQEAMAAKKVRGQSVASGREWADAYVKYIIYVHGLYSTIQAGPAHGVGE